MKVGIAISPNTPADAVFPYLHLVDMVLVMTVEPGFGGQALIPETLEKVRQIKEYITKNKIDIHIEVDGGIGYENIGLVTSNGANVIVAGSAIFKTADYAETIAKMRAEAEKNPYISKA